MKLFRPPQPARRNPDRKRRVLALVGDTQVGLWVTRSLGRQGLTVYAVCATARGLSAHSRYAAGAWRLESRPTQPGFAEELLALARELDVGSVMTIAESYHVALMAARSKFEPEVHLFSPPDEAFAQATDKDYMHYLCLRLGVPVARGATLDKVSAAGAEGLTFPLVLRARCQNDLSGAPAVPWKAAYAENRADLDRLQAQVAGQAANVLVQEYHPGVEDHVQILMLHGQPFMVGEYIGEHHMPLAGGVTVCRVSCRHEKLIADAVRLLQAIHWDGIAGVQFHYDPATDQYIFLEINPRYIGGLPTVIMAGFDAPFLQWQSYFEPERMRAARYRLGLRTRILGGDANWMLGMMRGDALPPGQRHVGKLAAAASFLWNCGPWTRDDVFWIKDPVPLWTDCSQMVRRLRQKSFDIVGNP